MKIDPASRKWTLTSGSHVLYTGYRSPWDPRLMRAAIGANKRCSGIQEETRNSTVRELLPHG